MGGQRRAREAADGATYYISQSASVLQVHLTTMAAKERAGDRVGCVNYGGVPTGRAHKQYAQTARAGAGVGVRTARDGGARGRDNICEPGAWVRQKAKARSLAEASGVPRVVDCNRHQLLLRTSHPGTFSSS